MYTKTWALIPARGGSKGVLRKNVRLLAGKPLVAHTREAALAARTVDPIVVSTDDRKIGEVSVRYEAQIVWRLGEISGDDASSESALLRA